MTYIHSSYVVEIKKKTTRQLSLVASYRIVYKKQCSKIGDTWGHMCDTLVMPVLLVFARLYRGRDTVTPKRNGRDPFFGKRCHSPSKIVPTLAITVWSTLVAGVTHVSPGVTLFASLRGLSTL